MEKKLYSDIERDGRVITHGDLIKWFGHSAVFIGVGSSLAAININEQLAFVHVDDIEIVES